MYEHLLYEHRSAVLIIITDLSIKLGPLLLGWRIGDSGFRIQILLSSATQAVASGDFSRLRIQDSEFNLEFTRPHPSGAQAVAPGDLSRLGAETLALVGGKSSPPTTSSSSPPRIIAVN